MSSNIKKAGTVIRKSLRSRRYLSLGQVLDENNYVDASPKRAPSERFRRSTSVTVRENQNGPPSVDESRTQDTQNGTISRGSALKRGASMTQSMRDAVGTIKQKFRTSTRRLTRLRNQNTPRAAKRRHSLGGKNVKMSSPFGIETPKHANQSAQTKFCLSLETPTRLRREVEDLTANMQALSALTPNTLHARSRARRSSPLTNGSLRELQSTRRRITTEIH